MPNMCIEHLCIQRTKRIYEPTRQSQTKPDKADKVVSWVWTRTGLRLRTLAMAYSTTHPQLANMAELVRAPDRARDRKGKGKILIKTHASFFNYVVLRFIQWLPMALHSRVLRLLRLP